MFLLNLTYLLPQEELKSHLEAHTRFLEEYGWKGLLVCSGNKADRSGEIILSNGIHLHEVEQMTKQDPLSQQNLAEYQITEFYPTVYADGFDIFIGI